MKSTTSEQHDLENLIGTALNDIGAMFDAIGDRIQGDATTSSLCSTGGHLCDTWQKMLRQQVKNLAASTATESRESRFRRRSKTAEVLLSLNPPAA